MKNITLLFLICLPVLLFGQADKTPNLFEYVNIQAIPGQEEAFEEAVKAHNAKYHAEGPYKAALKYTINGPGGGTYAWVMGPTSWTAMDDRPLKGEHDKDWAKVTALSARTGSPQYWTFDTELSRNAMNPANDKRMIWIYDLKPGQYSRWMELVAKVSEVYAKKRPTETFIVASNELADTRAGEDVGVAFDFAKWSRLDEVNKVYKDFEAVHCAGSLT